MSTDMAELVRDVDAVPDGWCSVRLGDVSRSFAGGTPSRSNPAYYGPGIPWLKSGEVRAGRIFEVGEQITELGLRESSARVARAGTPVIAMYGATAGVAGILEIDAALNQAVLAIEPVQAMLDNEFCFHLLSAEAPRLLTMTQGSGQPNLSKGLIDDWFDLQRLTRTFIKVYGDLSPDPAILDFTAEVKWAAIFLRLATQAISKDESLDHRSYTGKIRDMLEQHVHATGLSTTIRLRSITDPEFADDFDVEGKDEPELKEAFVRKSAELRRVTRELVDKNPAQYGRFPFAERRRERTFRPGRSRSGYDFPLKWLQYDGNVTRFYQRAVSADDPYVSFISYYHILGSGPINGIHSSTEM